MSNEPEIVTLPSCSNATAAHAGAVIVSGSYGGKYNAFNAAKWGIRGVIMNDAGVGADDAGIIGLPYLDQIGLPAATASADDCHIGDGDHTLAHGIISHVNQAASALGCSPGQTARACAERMRSARIPTAKPPPITEGTRVTLRDAPGEPKLICADSVGMIRPEDTGRSSSPLHMLRCLAAGPIRSSRLVSTQSSSPMPAWAWTVRASRGCPF